MEEEDDDHGRGLRVYSVCTDPDRLEDYLVLLRGTPPPMTTQRGPGDGAGGDDDDDAASAAPGWSGRADAERRAATYQPLLGALLQAPPEYT